MSLLGILDSSHAAASATPAAMGAVVLPVLVAPMTSRSDHRFTLTRPRAREAPAQWRPIGLVGVDCSQAE
jgi:hypothetical protein